MQLSSDRGYSNRKMHWWVWWLLLTLVGELVAQQTTSRNEFPNNKPPVALVGGTVLDVSGFGTSAHDLSGAVVLVRGGKIAAVGARGRISIPKDARIVDVAGKFILPGLIDGFAGLNSQGQANANLYMGVTTLVGSTDDRRGPLFLTASPGPHIYLLDSVGSTDDFALLGKRPEWASKLKGHDPDVE
jgi:hypothetical protein